MYLLNARVEEFHHIILELCASHDTIVHKQNLLTSGELAVGQQLQKRYNF